MTTDAYVLGFLHSYDLERWLLINKGQTISKAGNFLRWCGLGGQIIDSDLQLMPGGIGKESPHQAMEREFLEESGHLVLAKRWNCFHIKNYLHAKIYIFQCACSPDEIEIAKNVKYVPNREGDLTVHQYVDVCFKPEDYTFDLRYLIPMIILESQRGMLSQLDPEGVNSEYKKTLRT